MDIFRVESTNERTVAAILQIHAEMPLAWDPEWQVSPGMTAGMMEDVRKHPDAHAFWILAESGTAARDEIKGLIWATIKDAGLFGKSCQIGSFWLAPEWRGAKKASSLAAPVSEWAKERGAVSLDCSTHFTNTLMREILEAKGFRPGMVQYRRKL